MPLHSAPTGGVAAAAPTIPANTVLLFGDSITALNGTDINWISGPYPSTATQRVSTGFWNWADALLAARFEQVGNKGVGGNTTTQMLARLSTDVLALTPKPGWVLVQGGTNDIASTTVVSATVISNLKSIYDQIRAAGVNLIVQTVTPNNVGTANATQKLALATVNRFIRDYARRNSGVVLADIYAAVADATAGTYRTGYSTDQIHPVTKGAQAMGRVFAAALTDVTPRVPVLSSTALDTENKVVGGSFLGTGGTLGGGGATGSVATGWTNRYATGAALSKVARTDENNGEWQQITLASAPTASFDIYQQVAGLAAGDVVQAAVEFQADNDWTNCTAFGMQFQTQGTAVNHDVLLPSTSGSETVASPNGSGVLRSHPFTLPAGYTSNFFFLRFKADAGTVRWGRATVIKVA